MSRMGAKPINILDEVTVEIKGQEITCKGKNGQLTVTIHPKLKIEKKDNSIIINRTGNDKLSKSLHGVSRKLVINAIKGVKNNFEKKLVINGIGYRVSQKGNDLVFNLGYSHPIEFKAPDGIKFKLVKNTIAITVIDKQLVCQTAAQIRALRLPEPYKGKGIKYIDEIIQRKAGKAAKAAGGEGK
ncbi:MAG: 50S ribosomal protein L6 [Bacteroidales bacterium]|nr:50S ribosomal protein L6 [Bacteroidales bacterium]